MSGQRSDWRGRLNVSPSRMERELALRLQDEGVSYQTQVEIRVTTADFYFMLGPRPLVVSSRKVAQSSFDGEARIVRSKFRLGWQ